MSKNFERRGGSHDPEADVGIEKYKNMFAEIEKTINERLRSSQEQFRKLFDEDLAKDPNMKNLLPEELAQKKLEQINKYMKQLENETNGLREMQKELADLIKKYEEKEAEFKKSVGEIVKNNLN